MSECKLIRINLLKFFYVVLMAVVCASVVKAVPEPSVTKSDLEAQEKIFQLKLDSTERLLQKDIQAKDRELGVFKERLDKQDVRISDIGIYLTWFGGFITFVLAGLVYLGFVSVKRQAEEKAQEWFNQHAGELAAEISKLKDKAEKASADIDTNVEIVSNKKNAALLQVDEVVKTALVEAQENIQNKEPISNKNKQVIEQTAQALKDKPESSYSFDDWNTRAFAALEAKQLDEAIVYWDKAAKVPNAGIFNVAKATFNIGVALGELNRSEEAITVYDALIQAYQSDTTPALREQVASAMLNKGFVLGELKRSEEAITVYDALIHAYQSDAAPALREIVAKAMSNKGSRLAELKCSKEAIAVYDALIHAYQSDAVPALREIVAKAMRNKGVVLGELKRTKEAITVYDALIQAYQSDAAPALREKVGYALNGKGFNHLLQAKEKWEDVTTRNQKMSEASIDFAKAFERLPESAMVIGNQAYAAWLIGDLSLAKEKFNAALHASNGGGKTIYEGTLGDLEMHPVDVDAGFRELIDELYLAWSKNETSA